MEILAPAGNFAALKAAVREGADAVFLGLGDFNARSKAENFDSDALKKAVKLCGLFGVKIYLPANTLVTQRETDEAVAQISFAAAQGVDAVIVQDLGLAERIKKELPSLSLHASTQMGIHNAYGARVAERLGFDRVILSREVTLSDIREIREKTDIEIEVFVQGALCVAFSGNCYFSSLASGYSGNRGKCLQLCRKRYKSGNCDGYLLSAKDLCLIEHLQQLKSAGVDSIKIEGRLRSPEYVATSVRVYKKALALGADQKDIDSLKRVFNRGEYCKGYLFEPTADIIDPNCQSNIGLKIGEVVRINNGNAECKLTERLSDGDGIKFLRRGKETGHALVRGNSRDNRFVTAFAGNPRAGDEVRLTLDASLAGDLLTVSESNSANDGLTLDISMTFCARLGEPPKLSVTRGNVTVTTVGNAVCEPSSSCPLSRESVIKALDKLGDTYFRASDITVDIDKNIFCPVSVLNDMRRSAARMLQDALLKRNSTCKQQYERRQNDPKSINICSMSDIVLGFETKQAKFFMISDERLGDAQTCAQIYQAADYVVFNPRSYVMESMRRFCDTFGKKAILNLPIISRSKDLPILRQIVEECPFVAFIADNIYAVELCRGKKLIMGSAMNVLNERQSFCISSYETDTLRDSLQTAVYTYGYAPLMTFAHCPKRTQGGDCKNCNGYNLSLKDEKGRVFRLRRTKVAHCYSSLYNCVPTSLIDETLRLKSGSRLFDFTMCDRAEINSVLDALNGQPFEKPHTHGNVNKKLR